MGVQFSYGPSPGCQGAVPVLHSSEFVQVLFTSSFKNTNQSEGR